MDASIVPLAVADTDPRVRLGVLLSLDDPQLDAYSISPQFLPVIIAALHDDIVPVRLAAIRLCARLAVHSPALIVADLVNLLTQVNAYSQQTCVCVCVNLVTQVKSTDVCVCVCESTHPGECVAVQSILRQ